MKDGFVKWAEIGSALIEWKNKPATLNFISDITERKQAEEALKISEQNFRNSMDTSSIGINIVDTGFNTTYVNQAFLDIFGYKNIDEVRASPPYKYYTPKTNAGVIPLGEKIARGEPVSNQYEIEIIRKDSTIRHLQISRKEISWDGKQQYQILYNDITERKQTEKALKASEKNFRNSMDNTLVGIRISDIDNHTLYANQALLDIFGYKNIDEVRAKSPQAYYSPESYADYLKMREKYGHGEIMPDQVDIDIVRKDGTVRHLQALFKIVLWDGKMQYQTLYNDITDRKKAEEALRVSEEKYRLIVENSQDIIFTLDSAGKFIYVSPSVKQMLGYNQTDLIGRPFNSLIHPEDLHVIEDAIQRGDEAGYHQYRFRHASGEWRWHASRGTKMLDTGGKSFNFTGISNDITERKQAENNTAGTCR
jgi:PAS domain S-box-containing protein